MRAIKPDEILAQPPETDLLRDLEACISRYEGEAPNKSFASVDGWAYLIKDTNDWLRWQFGLRRWSPEQYRLAQAMMANRAAAIRELGAPYVKFIIPEKSIIYPQYMPGLLKYAPIYEHRPAVLMHSIPGGPVYYLQNVLKEYSKLGLTYFRGDSHPNFFGSYLIYRSIHATLSHILPLAPVLQMRDLAQRVATYGGDLFGQLAPSLQADLPSMFNEARPKTGCEATLLLGVDPGTRLANPVDVPNEYKGWFTSRETFVWQNTRRDLPSCVIFRDSTATHFLNYLAEHFSRTVAVWFGGRIVEDVIRREKPDVVIHIQAERLTSPMDRVPALFQMGAGRKNPATV